MKALSLWAPWGTAMYLGLKLNETRGWETTYSGDLLICQAKRKMTADELDYIEDLSDLILPEQKIALLDSPLGAALAVVDLVHCVHTESIIKVTPELEQEFGDYSPGRFAWMTENLRPLYPPTPIVGAQGLFNVEKCPSCDRWMSSKDCVTCKEQS